MSIRKAIQRAYENARSRGWNKIFLSVDIHDTIAESNYKATMPEIIPEAMEAVKYLNTLPEMCLILFSSCYDKDYSTYMKHFEDNGMHFKYFNENPEVSNTETGDFSKKFFYSALVDDKAGFDTGDWPELIKAVKDYRYLLEETDVRISFKIQIEPDTNKKYFTLYEFDMWDSIEYAGRCGPFPTMTIANNTRDKNIKQSLLAHSNYKKAQEAEEAFESSLVVKYPDPIERESVHPRLREEWYAMMEAKHPWFLNQSYDILEYGKIRELKVYL